MRKSYAETIRWEIANTPHHQVEHIPKGGSFDDITFDYLVDTANISSAIPTRSIAESSSSDVRPAASACS